MIGKILPVVLSVFLLLACSPRLTVANKCGNMPGETVRVSKPEEGNFTALNSETSAGKVGNFITSLVIFHGVVYFGYPEQVGTSSLAAFDGENLESCGETDGFIPSGNIYTLAIASDGYLWASTTTGDAYEYDGRDWFFYDGAPPSQLDRVISVHPSKDIIWTNSDGLTRHDRAKSEEKIYSFSGVNAIEFDLQENVWIATDSGAYYQKGEDWVAYYTDHPVKAIGFDADKLVILATAGNGLVFGRLP